MRNSKLSINKSLIIIVSQFITILVVLITLAFIQSEIMTSVRSYVRAEGLYAKGHMLAVQHLQNFIQTKSREEISLFKQNIAIPQGGRIAREALLQESPDLEMAFQGLLQGGNDPKDIPGMIRLFIYFHDIKYFRDAISTWEEADKLIDRLEQVAQKLFLSISNQNKSETESLISQLETINTQLVEHEINFSRTLAQGAHWIRELLTTIILSTLLILGVVSTILTKRLIRNISRTEKELESHRTKLQELIYERTHELENVIEGTNAGTWTWDLTTNIVDVNEKWLSMIGYSPGEIEAVDYDFWEKNLHEDDKPLVHEKLQSHLGNETDYYDVEFRLLHKQGWWVWINARGKVTERDASGKPLIMSGTHINITERKLVEKEREIARVEAEKSNQEKSRFLANMSHELRTPMHAIHSFTRIAMKRDLDPKVRHFLENIDVSTTRLTTLLNDLLDLSKLEAGKMELNPKEINLSVIINETISTLFGLLKEHGLNIDTSGIKDIKVKLDVSLITQVITNLMSNAIKFSPENGTIILTTKLVGRHVQVSIEDEGIGVPKDEQEKIFDSFVQSTKTMTNSGGTGLGLPISKEIIELHRGSIWVKSPPIGKSKGSSFIFQLPLETV